MRKPKYTYFFNKQPGYKQLALKWQIAKQLPGLRAQGSVSNKKKYRLKKSRVFPLSNKHKTAVRPTEHQNSAASSIFGKILICELTINSLQFCQYNLIWNCSWNSQINKKNTKSCGGGGGGGGGGVLIFFDELCSDAAA